MHTKRMLQLIVVVTLLVTSFTSTGSVLAWSGCASYINVQWGDTLSGLAATCGTTVEAIRAANPGLGWWVYAGQVLYIPTGYAPAPVYYPVQTYYPSYGTYVVQWGDTIGTIAASTGFYVNDILAVNPQIWNASLIYAGQVINLPATVNVPPPVYIPPPAYYPPPIDYSQLSTLKVTYGDGLLVRTGPGKGYPEIHSALVSAVVNTEWQYKRYTVTMDAKGLVWAEVILNPLVVGYSTGWVLVRDYLGNYFTDPHIDW